MAGQTTTERRFHAFDRRIQQHAGRILDTLRMFLGAALFVRGWYYIINIERLVGAGWFNELYLSAGLMAHYVAIAHIAGGLMLCIGFLTRIAALVQIPVLLGALFFVHFAGGVISPTGSFEFAFLVLILLIVYAIYGGGRWSVDEVIFRRHPDRSAAEEREAERYGERIPSAPPYGRPPMGQPT